MLTSTLSPTRSSPAGLSSRRPGGGRPRVPAGGRGSAGPTSAGPLQSAPAHGRRSQHPTRAADAHSTSFRSRTTLTSAERLDRSPRGPGPGDLTALRAGPVLLTLTAHTDRVTASGAVPRRFRSERSGTGHSGAGALGREPVRDERDGPRLTASSGPGRSARGRRRRRNPGSPPAVRNAQQGRGPLDGRRGGRGRS